MVSLSTENSIHSSFNHVYQALDRNNFSMHEMLDLSKVFNTINGSILLQKLKF